MGAYYKTVNFQILERLSGMLSLKSNLYKQTSLLAGELSVAFS